MSLPDFSDPEIDRKMSFLCAQKGCGLHRERYLCFFDMGDSEVLTAESSTLMYDLAKIHYEADFCAGTSANKNLTVREHDEDNYYLVDSLSDELCSYLSFKSKVVITEQDVVANGVESVRNSVIEALKRDRFKRDETTKVSYFKINTSAIKK